jgi:hypothetical protein
MPTTCGHKDSKGTYCQWGGHGAHYYYTPGDKESMERARKKADAQGAAVHSTGWVENSIEEKSSDIQSLRFNKDKYPDKESAISWAKDHNFKYNDVEEMPNEWRLRQFDPNKCIKSGGMKELAPGVHGYICPISDTKSDEILKQAEIELAKIKEEFEILKNPRNE